MSAKRILLVDDEDDIREVAAISMQAVGGWHVRAARSGSEAITIAIADPPDAILLDVMMPDLDGPATFRLLQDDPRTRDIPVILLTAKAQAADRRCFEALGVAGVLSKPFDPMALPGQVAGLLAGVPKGRVAEAPLASSGAIDKIWESSREEFTRRIATLEEAIAAIAAESLDDEVRERARSDAHKLAGSLGMFGLASGSGSAGEVEQAMGAGGAHALSDLPHLSCLVVALRDDFDTRSEQGVRLGAIGGAG